jgi:hypothetical protein
VAIVSPVDQECVASGLPPADIGVGGDPIAAPVDVPVRLRLAETAGAPIEVTIEVDGLPATAGRFVPAAAGVEEETDDFFIPAFQVEDGLARTIRVVATAGEDEATDTVTIDIDRTPPRVLVDEDDLALAEQCFEGAQPDIDFESDDALHPGGAPIVQTETVGCEVRRVVIATDSCGAGNASRLNFVTRRPPAEPITARIEGVDPGARVPEAALDYIVDSPDGCLAGLATTLSRDGAPAVPFGSGRPIDDEGDYTAAIVATPVCDGAPVEATLDFTVLAEPSADSGGPYAAVEGEELILSAARSAVPPELGVIVEYAWDLDADGFFDVEEGRGVEVPFDTSIGDGEYQVGVRITTDSNYRDFDYTTVTIGDASPFCDAGGPYEIEQGQALVLDGSASAGGHGSEPIVAWDWDFGDERFPQRADGLQMPVHRYQEEGTFTVTLTLEDRDSSVSCNADVTVLDVEPEIRNLAARGGDHVEGQPVIFTAGQTSAGSAAEPITNLRWDFGDGTVVEGADLRGPQHVYDQGGEFEVCLEVFDVDSSVRECIVVSVRDLRPVARVEGPLFADEGEAVTFDASFSRFGGVADPILRYVWDFGDGTDPVTVEAPDAMVTHVFETDGLITVTLRVEPRRASAATAGRRCSRVSASPSTRARAPVAPTAIR